MSKKRKKAVKKIMKNRKNTKNRKIAVSFVFGYNMDEDRIDYSKFYTEVKNIFSIGKNKNRKQYDYSENVSDKWIFIIIHLLRGQKNQIIMETNME